MESESAVIRVILVGCGQVGRAVLRKICAGRKTLFDRKGVAIHVLGVIASKDGVVSMPFPFEDADLQQLADGGKTLPDFKGAFTHSGWHDQDLQHALRPYGEDVTFVDASNGDHADLHLKWLRRGHGVVTANKKPLVAPMPMYRDLVRQGSRGRRYRYETTVGAGLPVIAELEGLLVAGETLVGLDAMTSGTISYVLSACERGKMFGEAVVDAKAAGLTEPNPWDDLSGADVATKAVILARLAGIAVERADILPENLVPKELRRKLWNQCLPLLAKRTFGIDHQIAEACVGRERLRYLTRIADGKVSVGLERVAAYGSFGRLAGAANMFVIRTSPSHLATPLVIEGPGAGPYATAAGVIKDLLCLHGVW